MKFKLSSEKLKELEEHAESWFSIDDLATILGVDYLDLQGAIHRSGDNEIRQAFFRGRLKTEAKTRAAVFKAAADGSGPAQTLAMKIIDDVKIKEL